MAVDAFQASIRFGLGPRPGEMQAIGNDARGWLKAQIEKPVYPAGLRNPEKPVLHKSGMRDQNDVAKKEMQKEIRQESRGIYISQTARRFEIQSKTIQPFLERLVLFWSNHFTVSIQKGITAGLVNAFEAEAVRPHVTGNFYHMLRDSSKHPAMLLYLDNAQSSGPNSLAGKRRGKGLNENLAREILELHTLGVNGGYTQGDVTSFAKVITGWTLSREDGPPKFEFLERVHEPGAKTILGKTYQEEGVNEGLRVLYDLAHHKATAVHIATKLARHFVADVPPREAIQKLANVFYQTQGDLKAVSLALIDMPQCWDPPFTKFKTPYEYTVSAARLLNLEFEDRQLLNLLQLLNYRPFNATSPAGYADTQDTGLSSGSVMQRVEFAQRIAQMVPPNTDPMKLAHENFGHALGADTLMVIKGAASGADGIAFLLSSPEFLRR